METLFRFNLSILFLILIFQPAFANAQSAVRDACFRLEGTNMSCAGGGAGTQCTESCASKFPNINPDEECESVLIGTICEGKVQCRGRKCCGTCESDPRYNTQCGQYTVCGQTCTGKGPPDDCSKIAYCKLPETVDGTIHVAGSCDVGNDSSFSCGGPIKQLGDGCVCTCQPNATAKTCTAVNNGKCTDCQCSPSGITTPGPPGAYCVNVNRQCTEWKPAAAIQEGCGCKCPPYANPTFPACSSCLTPSFECKDGTPRPQ